MLKMKLNLYFFQETQVLAISSKVDTIVSSWATIAIKRSWAHIPITGCWARLIARASILIHVAGRIHWDTLGCDFAAIGILPSGTFLFLRSTSDRTVLRTLICFEHFDTFSSHLATSVGIQSIVADLKVVPHAVLTGLAADGWASIPNVVHAVVYGSANPGQIAAVRIKAPRAHLFFRTTGGPFELGTGRDRGDGESSKS